MTTPNVDAERARLAEIARLSHVAANDAEVAYLIDCLGQPHKAVQRQAARALAQAAVRGVAVAAALQRALGDAAAARRWGAAYALSLIGPPPAAVLPTLLDVLGSADGDLRWAAADILKRLGATATSDLLRLAAHGNAAQRKMALYCLRDLRVITTETEAAVRAALLDTAPGVRLAALAALPHLGRERHAAAGWILPLADDADPGVRRAAIIAFGILGLRTSEIEAVVRGAAQSVTDPGLRRAAERAMKMLGIVQGPESKV
ncbi:MAG TPA: HEAT repeat domain-containing protein [Candidatus Kryptonia bacterium]|nr:HEAT repeat domain-containing protein [Candidatus Kryptonia bacterium]